MLDKLTDDGMEWVGLTGISVLIAICFLATLFWISSCDANHKEFALEMKRIERGCERAEGNET